MRRPPTSPFEIKGPFGGLMELPSPKHIAPNQFAAASNVQQKGGRVGPRPGFSRVRDDSLVTFTDIATLSDAKQIVLDTSTSPDRLGYVRDNKVYSIDVDGTDNTLLLTADGFYASGLDIASTTMYVGIHNGDEWEIGSLLFDTTYTTLIQMADSERRIIDLVVDATYIFYTCYDSTLGWQLRRCTLAGGSDTLLTSSLTTRMGGMTYDTSNNHIFICLYDPVAESGDNLIGRYDTSGTQQETFAATAPHDVEIDTTNNRIYWTSNTSGVRSVNYASYTPASGAVSGSSVLISLDSSARPWGVAVDSAGDKIYVTNGPQPDATNTLIVSQNNVRNIVLDTSTNPDRIGYILGDTSIRTVNVDGTGDAQVSAPGLTQLRGLSLNGTTMYLCGKSSSEWKVASLTFAGTYTDLFGVDNDDYRFIDIAVTSTDMYVTMAILYRGTATGNYKISKRALSAPETETASVTVSNQLGGLVVDGTNSHLFVSGTDPELTSGTDVIYRYNLSLVLQDSFAATDVHDIALDTTNNRVYWTTNVSGDRSISYVKYAPATGEVSTPVTVEEFASSYRPRGIAVDGANNTVYASNGAESGGRIFKLTFSDIGSIFTMAEDPTIVSSFFWRRSLVGDTTTTFTDDLMLLQLLYPQVGGSVFKVWFPSRTAPNDLFALSPGYTAGSGTNPDIFCMVSRTVNSSGTDPVIPTGNYGRASYAYTSRGFDTNRGGVLVCASSGAYVFNYYTGDTADTNEVQTVTVMGAPTGGTYQLTLGTTATANIAYNADAATFETTLTTALATDTASATCDVTRSGSGSATDPYVYTVTFTGALAGIGLPLLRMTTNGLTGGVAAQVAVERTTQGTSHPDGILWLRPAGLPRPSAPTVGSPVSGGNLTGVYDYVISFYSSQLGIESPPSEPTTSGVLTADHNEISWTVPSTLYFNTYFSATSIPGGPVIDRVRIYRKKTGTSAAGDGIAADPSYAFVADVQANRAAYLDNVADGSRTAETIPTIKEYPPSDAQFVTVLDGTAYYAGVAANSKVVWNSEKTLLGGVWDGELGYEYVSETSYTEAFDDSATDHHLTALAKLGGQLVVGTDERVLAADVSQVDTLGLAFRPIEGSAGIASHWCVAETNPLAGDEIQGGLLLYANPKGGMYAFDGVKSFPIARDDISKTVKTFSRKTWQDTSLGFGSITSWYWGSVTLDPYNNRIIMSAPLTAGGATCMVYDLDTKTWLPWSINKLAWTIGREWDDDADLGAPIVLFFDGSSIYKLVDGENDDGMNFSWSVTTGLLDLGSAIHTKVMKGVVADFDVEDFGGSSPTVTVAARLDGDTTANASTAFELGQSDVPRSERYLVQVPVTGRARHLQVHISGTQSSNLTHPLLCAIGIESELAGVRLA